MQTLAVLLFLSFLQAGQAAGNGWQSFGPKDGGFTVLVPAQPTEHKKQVKSSNGTVDVLLFEVPVSPGDGRLIVGVSEFPESMIVAGTEDKRLDNARDGAVASAKGKLKREKSLVLGTYPGRELYIEVEGKATVLMRLYAVKNRLYQLVVVGSADLVTSQTAEKFLVSFKLAK
jgi:hypothetical protein